jgi:transketolase
MKRDLAKVAELATAIRVLSAQAVDAADSGHPGMPLGAADYSAMLWSYFLSFDPSRPDWLNRDRFVLSAGHGSMLIYSLLHLFGYDVPMDQIKQFRQWGSLTPGHPEYGHTQGVETTTGPLGQGFANGVGFALSQKMMGARYDETLFNSHVFGIVSDGDLMEGVASEAASLAGHLKLDNLIYLYDDNLISLAGETKVCFTEDVPTRFKAYGWEVTSCDGHDLEAIASALDTAVASKGKPKIICCRTIIGKGSPSKAGGCGVHGSPLGKDETNKMVAALGWNEQPFTISANVKAFTKEMITAKSEARSAWDKQFSSWQQANKDKADQLSLQLSGELPAKLKDEMLQLFSDGKPEASRSMSGRCIQVIAKHLPGFIGGSADLESSTKTLISGAKEVQAGSMDGRNIRYGVREHGMASMVNGLAYTRQWVPFGSTFLVFSDYLRPTLRIAGLSHIQAIQIFTHDSFWVGEDGPTHQPIEHVQSLRLIPNLYVYRPADGVETAMCYWSALSMKRSPSTLLFTRQNLPALNRASGCTPEMVQKGGYILSGAEHKDLVIIATGSEVQLAVAAAAQNDIKARVVSMPCVELFLDQDKSYRDQVVPPSARVITIEAGTTVGWERFAGKDGLMIGRDTYGASAPGELLAEKFGFTEATVIDRIRNWM